MTTPEIRRADAAGVATMLDWAAAEGWNPGLSDAAAFHAADPEGFFLAVVDGRPAGAVSVVNHSDRIAFLGLFLVRPDLRGRGIGRALWAAGLAHAGERTVGLDGVAAQEANYARDGFVRTGATRRFAGRLEAGPVAGVRPFRPDDLPALTALDAAAGGYARPVFLRHWLTGDATRATVVRDGLDGFATARLCREGVKVGPVLAPDATTALALASAAAARFPAAEVLVDAAPGAGFETTLAAAGFAETFATARMFRGPAPRPGPALHAIATMELG